MTKEIERSEQALPSASIDARSPEPAAAPPVPQRPRRKRARLIISLSLALLALVIVLAGLLAYFNSAAASPLSSNQPTVLPSGSLGPFIKPPYTPNQINALRTLLQRMNYRELAGLYVSHMTLDEKLGQMIMTESEQNNYSDDLDYMITQQHVGGFIMYDSHLQTAAQAKNTTRVAQSRAAIPLLTSVDEEGGSEVNRLVHIYGSRPGPWEVYQSGSLDFARQQGKKMARDLLAVGLNTDLAPDVDVMLVQGIDTYDRTFGTTAASVIKYAGPYTEAMQGNGLIACMKHYPGGLGDTPYDAHTTLPSDNRSRAQIYATELAPYQTYINSPNPLMRPGMIMSTDVLMPAIDPKMPAELSHIFMTDILRKEFGYDGVVLTDALYMDGISARWSEPEAAVLAIQAGNDMVLGPMGSARTAAVIEGFRLALHNGRLSMTRVNEAVARIIALKMQYHLMPTTLPQN